MNLEQLLMNDDVMDCLSPWLQPPRHLAALRRTSRRIADAAKGPLKDSRWRWSPRSLQTLTLFPGHGQECYSHPLPGDREVCYRIHTDHVEPNPNPGLSFGVCYRLNGEVEEALALRYPSGRLIRYKRVRFGNGVSEHGLREQRLSPEEGVPTISTLVTGGSWRAAFPVRSTGQRNPLTVDVTVDMAMATIRFRILDPTGGVRVYGPFRLPFGMHGAAPRVYVRNGEVAPVELILQHRFAVHNGPNGYEYLHGDRIAEYTYASPAPDAQVLRAVYLSSHPTMAGEIHVTERDDEGNGWTREVTYAPWHRRHGERSYFGEDGEHIVTFENRSRRESPRRR